MNKQEKNIVDILTFDEIEDIVDIFIDKVYYTDKTVALITNKELVEYAMDELLMNDGIVIKKIDLELDNIEYMISVDNDGNMVVQPVEYYNDKYFKGIECAYIDMDGIVCQMTIDKLLDRDVPIVLFGYDDECECACQKDEKLATTISKSTYKINNKEVTKEEFDAAMSEIEDKYLDNVRDILLGYCDVMDRMNQWRSRLF